MKGHTHIIFAVVLGTLYFDYFTSGDWMLKLGFAATLIFGALLPDIDEKKSTLSHKHPLLHSLAASIDKHRGLFHTIWIPLIIFLVSHFVISRYFSIPNLLLMGLFIGYGSHLLADSFTLQGTAPLHPIHKGRIKGMIKTGGILEFIFMIGLVVFLLVY